MIRIITGAKHDGKTTAMLDLYYREGGTGSGVYARKCEENSIVSGYDLCLLPSKKCFTPFIKSNINKLKESPEFYVQGLNLFYKKAFEQANEYLLLLSDASSIWIDEVGKLELEDKGFADALQVILTWNIPLTVTVREFYLESFLQKYLNIPSMNPEELSKHPDVKIIKVQNE